MTTRTNWRRRNHQQNEGFKSRNSNRWHDKTSNEPRSESPRIGAYSVGATFDHHNPNHNPPRGGSNRQKPHNPFANSNPPRNSSKRFHDSKPDLNPAADHPHIGSTRFKEYLLSSISQTLQQIQGWYPDRDQEIAGSDGMDWQPEGELLFPQPAQGVNHISDPAPSSVGPIAEEVPTMEQPMKGEMPIPGRAASEGCAGVGTAKGGIGGWGIPGMDGFGAPSSVDADMRGGG